MVADVEGLAAAAENLPAEQVQRLKANFNIKGRMILYVGRLHPLKGCMELLEGWSDFEKEHPDGATLVMVGDGEQGEALETFCREKELQNVRFAGAVDYDQIAPYYASSDAFIIPTLEDNWSLVVPEAMSCGLPILCSKYNGCWPELVQEGRNGWVFDPQEPARIYDTLKSMMHAEALGQMGEESKEIIKAHTPARSAESVYNACVQALAHRNRSPRKSPSDKGGRGD
ncbi:MAG: glycosyltransferase family 4 protein [Candidatus Sumerlaeota bacterium]